MNVIRFSDASYAERLSQLMAPSSLFDPAIEQQTRLIIEAVRREGDGALVKYARRFDGVRLSPDKFPVSRAELSQAAAAASVSLRRAIAAALENLETFSRKSVRKSWQTRNQQEGKIGEKFDPYHRVGVYIPGGAAPLASTALMTVALAKAAGCPEIVVCTPCGKDGLVNPSLLYAAGAAGATEIYRVGGAQAIAAMALGTPTIRRTQKIFGPGNAYVVAAKRLLFGYVSIDLLPGPSEVLVLADETAKARFIAADMLAQAEHGSGHERVWLVTTSGNLIGEVQTELESQLTTLPRREFIEKALAKKWLAYPGQSLAKAIELANRLAPEHCEVMTRNPDRVAQSIRTAGALCLGHYTPNVLGDYLAGPSHVLPTGGAGASFAGLTVDQFQRRTSVIQYDRAALEKSVPIILEFAEVEGLTAHGRSAAIRLERNVSRKKGRLNSDE
ncbi:MAG: histidinol dehydrogenase [Candidatus Omnitrophica bacterium]|nr:histidinol dehydrogenase [Candidatus Omnitrophota bacterium]